HAAISSMATIRMRAGNITDAHSTNRTHRLECPRTMAPDPEHPDDDHSTLARIIGERKEKAAALRASGRDPYRNDFRPSHTIAEVRARYEPTKPAPPTSKPVKGPSPDNDPAGPRSGAAPPAPGIVPVDGEVVRIAGR